MSLAALLHVVVGADRNGLEILLRADDMFDGVAELRGQLTVRHKHESDHSVMAPVIVRSQALVLCSPRHPADRRRERYLVDATAR